MSEPLPPPFDASLVIEMVRAEIRDAGGAVFAYYGGPLVALDANVPAGGSYTLIPVSDARQWPPVTPAFDHLPPEPAP